ncbi:hypothetical protein H2199_006179 [Coniosporium tulheliwenetii]|uniref:Uncharacterized protein n=1 Tax=Coniosporium tulheliwenetii TaxID=3383036 RepID=A0ACC2YWZ7_9PEZI|nr:hypothetical protein H2199_006179 [Cladosporium sp. JES 115]
MSQPTHKQQGFALVYGGTLLVRHYVKKHRARKAARRETAARTEAWVNAVDPESTWVIDFEITITGGVIVDTSVTITDLVGLGYRGT